MKSTEPYSHDCSLNDIVEHFNNTLLSALNTVAQIKVRKKVKESGAKSVNYSELHLNIF